MRIGLLAPARRVADSFLRNSMELYRSSGENLGNFAFVEALSRHLGPNTLTLSWSFAPEEARERCDLLVIAAANQLGAHSDLDAFAAQLEQTKLPVLAVGLGAQAPDMSGLPRLPPGTMRWVRTLAGLAPSNKPNIGLRGEFTRRVLEKLGLANSAVITGCPSNFLNDRPDFYRKLARRARELRIDNLCVAAGCWQFADACDAERQLATLLRDSPGAYVVQHPLEMIRLARGEADHVDPAQFEEIRRYTAPDLSADAFRRWLKARAVCFHDAPSWLEKMRTFDFAVGARLHGVILAIQAGVPGGVIAHDSRTLELCQTMSIPVRLAHETPVKFGLEDLPRLFPFDVPAYAATRERLRQTYLALLRSGGVATHEGVAVTQKLAA